MWLCVNPPSSLVYFTYSIQSNLLPLGTFYKTIAGVYSCVCIHNYLTFFISCKANRKERAKCLHVFKIEHQHFKYNFKDWKISLWGWSIMYRFKSLIQRFTQRVGYSIINEFPSKRVTVFDIVTDAIHSVSQS